ISPRGGRSPSHQAGRSISPISPASRVQIEPSLFQSDPGPRYGSTEVGKLRSEGALNSAILQTSGEDQATISKSLNNLRISRLGRITSIRAVCQPINA